MLLTIERIRTGVLIAGALLIVALGVFLTLGRWRSPFNRHDLPKKLGIDVQQEANGFTQAGFHAGHATFRITASKVEQLKNDRYRLHVVKIEMFDPNGSADRIEGAEFEYDQQAGVARAAGPVEITLNRPPGKEPGAPGQPKDKADTQAKKDGLPGAAANSPANQIHVRTSGLTFNQNSGVAETAEHVDFDLVQGSGSSIGASYDSQNGKLVLDRAVDLNTRRGADPVHLQAEHAEFDRDANICSLRSVTAQFRKGEAQAEQATVLLREDGSAQKLDAANGLKMTTAGGGTLAAAAGTLLFDEDNQPRQGHLSGGVTLDSASQGRTLRGAAPEAQLEFDDQGFLRHAHLERKVTFDSEQRSNAPGGLPATRRHWTSPVADLDFHDSGRGQLALSAIHGTEGVEVTSQSQRAIGAATEAHLRADDVRGIFAGDSILQSMTGVGHARLDQTTETGTLQSTTGNRIEAHFGERADDPAKHSSREGGSRSEIDTAAVTGDVVLVEQPGAKPGAGPQPALKAYAARADYDGASEILKLTGSPRVENGGLELTADTIDVARATGDAFAHGNVKATWFGRDRDPSLREGQGGGEEAVLGSGGPAHVISAEAQLHQQTGEASFRGRARLWQQANSVSAPLIVLDRSRQTLVAKAETSAEPVRVVLLSANRPGPGQAPRSQTPSPSVIRVQGGDLKYSDAERLAVMRSSNLGPVVTETGTAITHSNELELTLLPPGNHAARQGASAQVDKMIARGHVAIDSQGRRGTGEQLAFSSDNGDYVLTGTAAQPPRITDPVRGTVTGGVLIFNSRDDSVKVEGDGGETTTETTAPKRP